MPLHSRLQSLFALPLLSLPPALTPAHLKSHPSCFQPCLTTHPYQSDRHTSTSSQSLPTCANIYPYSTRHNPPDLCSHLCHYPHIPIPSHSPPTCLYTLPHLKHYSPGPTPVPHPSPHARPSHTHAPDHHTLTELVYLPLHATSFT